MTDITPMPNNAENYYRKALNALELNQYAKGISLLEKSYEIEKMPNVFEELVRLYVLLDRPKDLKRLWSDNNYSIKDISDSNQLTSLYAYSVSIMNPTSGGLNKLYQLKDLNQNVAVNETLLKNIDLLTEQLNVEEELQNIDGETSNQDYIEKLLSYSQFDLLSKLKIFYKTNSDNKVHLLTELIKEPSLLNFVKNDILHYLVSHNHKNKIAFNWFGEIKEFDLGKAQHYEKTLFYMDGISAINNYFAKSDPHFATQITEIFNLHSMVLYPFYNESIKSAHTWLKLTLNLYGLDDGPYTNLIVSDTELHYYQLAQQEIEQLFQ